MIKKPYMAPALESLGDVVTITQADQVAPTKLDANYPEGSEGKIFTDNIVN